MEGEIQRFINVWLTVIASLCYSYAIGKLITKGPIRLLAILPVISLFLYLPLNLTSVHLGGTTAFFIAWLANFKLLLFSFSKGPLSSDPPISLPRFIALACFPIKIQQTQIKKPFKKSKHSTLSYTAKGLLLALLIRAYDYSEYINQNLILVLYCLHIYFMLEIILATIAVATRVILSMELEPQFDEPFLSTSLQDFWGRRWNIMVTSILRPTVYDPTIQVCERFISRRLATLVAIMATFMVSALMHELIFFYLGREKPTWGITWFFVLHGFCVVLEVVVKRVVGKSRWRLPPLVSRPMTVLFVVVPAFWLFFPEFLRCKADVRAFEEYAALTMFAKDLGRSIMAVSNSLIGVKI